MNRENTENSEPRIAKSPPVRSCDLEVIAGPDRGRRETFDTPTFVIGRGAADFKLADRAVSSKHLELRWTPQGYRIRDLGSTNGTYLKGVRVIEGFVQPGAIVVVGGSSIACHWSRAAEGEAALANPPMSHKGIVGRSPQILRVLDLIERLAPSNSTVLIHGETGSGKELVAEALHQGSMRAAGPFMVLDCSAIPAHLFEDQLFGHEAGSFTGADRKAEGVFEAAHGGTVFLDEVGEIPLEMQAKLLRVLESRQIRKIGSNRLISCDVRIVAATHRDLAAAAKRGDFRSDLYYRLAVAKIEVPPLRERKEDLEPLIEYFRDRLDPMDRARLPVDFLEKAHSHSWPGNIRELRNAVEYALALPQQPGFSPLPGKVTCDFENIDPSVPFNLAKQGFVDEFDRQYLRAILTANKGNVSAAARAAGMDRMTIYKIMRRLNFET